jgi:uncharacterized membrane protein
VAPSTRRPSGIYNLKFQMTNQNPEDKLSYKFGKIFADLLVVSIFSGALIWSFDFTIPQGIVLGWFFYLINSGIRSKNKDSQ